MQLRQIDVFIVPRFDAHQGEYIAPHDERLAFLTGFTGSAGMAIVTKDQTRLFVDGRYTVQAQNQCPVNVIERDHIFENPPETWLAEVAKDSWTIGYDAMLLPPSWVDRFAQAVSTKKAKLIAQYDNLVDTIWDDQPEEPFGQISSFPLQYAGVSPDTKRNELLEHLKARDVGLLVETQPDNIAWMLNVRGDDVAYNPMPQSYLLLEDTGAAHWFVDTKKFENGLRDTLPQWLELHSKSEFLLVLKTKVIEGKRVLADPDFSPAAVRNQIEQNKGTPVLERSILTIRKSQKNTTELEGLRACHLEDGAAWAEFGAWLSSEVPKRAAAGNPVMEYEAESQIHFFRKRRASFLSDSFRSISCAGGNAAMCHYAADLKNSAPVLPESCYLMDSGGQYETGTTDATRSYTFGSYPDGYREAYTAVFKAFVALATVRFPDGTQGHHIDAICRRPLWDLGLDYDHGTGHGIGHRLSVHEHPQRIGKPHSPFDLLPGVVMSIEPGHYKAELYGIRLENLFEIIELNNGFYGFQTITWIPIQTAPLLLDRLTNTETDWLNEYHTQVESKISPRCTEEAAAWLKVVCKPLSN
ncbi:aminopeptidase P family protein [Roseibium sp.]|uniref:aminopeptidase P family protein n=1 Tax=Roseibium sp. TaxID=1936156 RepID=UPI003B517E90